MTMSSCKTRDINLNAIDLELCHFLIKILSKIMAPDRRALVLHVVLLLYFIITTVYEVCPFKLKSKKDKINILIKMCDTNIFLQLLNIIFVRQASSIGREHQICNPVATGSIFG